MKKKKTFLEKRRDWFFLICTIIAIVMGGIVIINRQFPAFIVISSYFLVFPIFQMVRKGITDWGTLFLKGMGLAIIYILCVFGIILLAKNNEMLKVIVLWPVEYFIVF